ncbi:MAG TPA: YggT family protein [Burkholderiaceae bacterium]|nr:YggT family protein [Burkholderiaceae bacterium]
MLEVFAFLLNVAAGFLAGACLLRALMQWLRVGFQNPLGQFARAVSDWLVLPLRRALPTAGRWDIASLVAAWLIEMLQITLLWAVGAVSGIWTLLPLLAGLGMLRLALTGMMALVLLYAILSWVSTQTPLSSVLRALCEPVLEPLRRRLPAPGGFDLSPLVVVVLLQAALMVVARLESGLFLGHWVK